MKNSYKKQGFMRPTWARTKAKRNSETDNYAHNKNIQATTSGKGKAGILS